MAILPTSDPKWVWGSLDPAARLQELTLPARVCAYLTLCNPMDCNPPSSSTPWDFPGKNTGVEMATHSSTHAWKIPWTEEPGAGYCPWGCKESETTERLHFHFHCRGCSRHRDWIHISYIGRQILYHCTTWETQKQQGKQLITYKEFRIGLSVDFSAETLLARESGMMYLNVFDERGKPTTRNTQQGSHSDLMERSEALQTESLRTQRSLLGQEEIKKFCSQ